MEVTTKRRILFFCSRFGGGGAERHLLRILNHANFDQFQIMLALTRAGGNYESDLDARIQVKHLANDHGSSFLSLISSVRPLTNLVKSYKPDLVVSIMDRQNMVACVLKMVSKSFPKLIIICQNAPYRSLSDQGVIGSLFLRILPALYNKADKIIAICNGVAEELKNKFKITKEIKVIYNAGFDSLDQVNYTQDDKQKRAKVRLIFCGRLTKQKGLDILIQAISEVRSKNEIELWILGEGHDRIELESMVRNLQLDKIITFRGFVSNPMMYFRDSDIFILPSRWEGFGNVIVEAMLCGLPVIATDCDFGPNEIIDNGYNGMIVPTESVEKLSGAIDTLVQDENLRAKYSINGKKRAEDFSPDMISKEYFKYFFS